MTGLSPIPSTEPFNDCCDAEDGWQTTLQRVCREQTESIKRERGGRKAAGAGYARHAKQLSPRERATERISCDPLPPVPRARNIIVALDPARRTASYWALCSQSARADSLKHSSITRLVS